MFCMRVTGPVLKTLSYFMFIETLVGSHHHVVVEQL